MEKILVKADKRPESGKGSARSLRRMGLLPAIVYSDGNSTPIKINGKEMTKLIYSGGGEHALITIELNEDGTKTSEHSVLVKDFQRDPVSEELLHVDFIEISLKKVVKVTVPVVIVKQPAGVKMGGILQYRLREVEVECLPTVIPDRIEVDAEFVEIGNSLHVSDLPVQEGVTLLTNPAEIILLVSSPVAEEAPAEAAGEEAAEPELVKAKGKEGEEQQKEEKKEGEK
ncbi:MAG TPA: 50S ribosomal protein L25 [Nitrospirae bacterium]|nr:50S ribosomal protein L25 [bacterium BMS3Abin06]HDH13281.1 50S ribosomal protein L25 [Nitrospirota bacterium]HDZ01751.1 50S ribosomal protein L25 [Nitrospirota bacterium]